MPAAAAPYVSADERQPARPDRPRASRRATRTSSTPRCSPIAPNSNSGGNSGCGGAQGCQLGVWATTNGGTTWTFMAGSAGGSLRSCTNTAGDYPQNWYDQAVAVDPNNPDRVFVGTFDVWFATRTGTAFNDVTCGYSFSGSAGPVHTDQHALAFVPGSSSTMLIGNDGGVNVTGERERRHRDRRSDVDQHRRRPEHDRVLLRRHQRQLRHRGEPAGERRRAGQRLDVRRRSPATRPARCSGRWATAATASSPASTRSAAGSSRATTAATSTAAPPRTAR